MKNKLISLGYACCWGVGLTLAKLALSEMTATTLLIVQLLTSAVFLNLLCFCKDGKLPLSLRHLQQGVAGIFEPALAYMFGTVGLALTTATNATLIGSTEVVLTIIFAAVFLKEKLTPTKLLLAVLSFAGVFLLVGGDAQGANQNSLFGDLLVLLGTGFAVVYVLCSKKQVTTIRPLELTASQQWVGLIATTLGFGVLSLLNPDYEVRAVGISAQIWLIAIASGIMQYALAFLLYLTALKTVPVSQAAFYISLIPVFGVASAVLLLCEQPKPEQWLGAVCIILASVFSHRQNYSPRMD